MDDQCSTLSTRELKLIERKYNYALLREEWPWLFEKVDCDYRFSLAGTTLEKKANTDQWTFNGYIESNDRVMDAVILYSMFCWHELTLYLNYKRIDPINYKLLWAMKEYINLKRSKTLLTPRNAPSVLVTTRYVRKCLKMDDKRFQPYQKEIQFLKGLECALKRMIPLIERKLIE